VSPLPKPSPRFLAHTANRSRWAPSGPWTSEPDTALWLTTAGLPGAIVRHEGVGHLGGYVAVRRGHLVFGMTPADVQQHDYRRREGRIEQSREVTFGAPGSQFLVTEGSDDADAWWWIGFGCAEADDGGPTSGPGAPMGTTWTRNAAYRTFEDVKAWVEELAEGVVSSTR
jgi:hypothetical protein